MNMVVTYHCACGAKLQLLTGWRDRTICCPNCDAPVPLTKEIGQFLRSAEAIQTTGPGWFEAEGLDS